jgi:hypothetical protein
MKKKLQRSESNQEREQTPHFVCSQWTKQKQLQKDEKASESGKEKRKENKKETERRMEETSRM